jgi:cell pole-organizing protein PopZ
MSDAKGASNDPSMDDILASIRKIISDDEARAQVNAGAGSPSAANAASSPGAKRDDVLLLTDLVEEPPEAPATRLAPPPTQRIDPISAGDMPQPAVPPFASVTPVVSAIPVEAPVKQPSPETLVEPSAAGVAASAFERLSHAVQDSVPPPVAQDPGPSMGSGGRSLEDIVKEMLRPMLKDWLDKNLPPLVERYVEREIVRLTRR